jgi:hypothetical protein
MGQLLTAFPYLMKLKYAFQTEEGKERTENPEKPSTSQSRGPLFFLNNITQLLFSRNQTGRKLLQAWDRNFYQEFYDTTSYGLQDRIRKLEKLFQGEKGLTNNPRRLKRPKTLCHRTLEKLGFWTLVEKEPPLLSSDSKIAYWALINYCRLEQQDLSEARTKIMKSRGSQNSYVQESILAVNNLNRQIIQLQMGINELVRFPTIAQYLMLPLDQREESLIKGCVKRQGNYFLLLDYDPTTEEDQFFSSMSLLLATPHFPPDLSEILGIKLNPTSHHLSTARNLNTPATRMNLQNLKRHLVLEKKIPPKILYKKLKTGPKKNGNRITSLPLPKRKQKKMKTLLFTKKT